MSERRFSGDEIEYLCSRCVSKSDAVQLGEIEAALQRVRDEVYRSLGAIEKVTTLPSYQFVGSGTVNTVTTTSTPVQTHGAPQITIRIRSDTYRFTPLRDITAFEATRIMSLLIPMMVTTIAPIDLDTWWDEAGPSIWRHFTAVG